MNNTQPHNNVFPKQIQIKRDAQYNNKQIKKKKGTQIKRKKGTHNHITMFFQNKFREKKEVNRKRSSTMKNRNPTSE